MNEIGVLLIALAGFVIGYIVGHYYGFIEGLDNGVEIGHERYASWLPSKDIGIIGPPGSKCYSSPDGHIWEEIK